MELPITKPDGDYILVPTEPTQAMLNAYDEARAATTRVTNGLETYNPHQSYWALLHAANHAGSVPERETWWLVERKTTPPQYVIQKHSTLPSLTADPWRAARFATEREAFDYRLRLSSLRDECKETEHVFINKR
jgi:hypothetical protein